MKHPRKENREINAHLSKKQDDEIHGTSPKTARHIDTSEIKCLRRVPGDGFRKGSTTVISGQHNVVIQCHYSRPEAGGRGEESW